jgi:hypothetical protein
MSLTNIVLIVIGIYLAIAVVAFVINANIGPVTPGLALLRAVLWPLWLAGDGSRPALADGLRMRWLIPALCAFVLIATCTKARANTPQLPTGFTCEAVRAKVAEHGKIVAYAWAKLKGYSKK